MQYVTRWQGCTSLEALLVQLPTARQLHCSCQSLLLLLLQAAVNRSDILIIPATALLLLGWQHFFGMCKVVCDCVGGVVANQRSDGCLHTCTVAKLTVKTRASLQFATVC
jgi:hypothetical protein